jgi:sugar phosphate isomerase/epimerase
MATNRPVIALQLYTVRDATAQDMIGTLRRVAELGYEGVELAGTGNASIDEIAAALKKFNLQCVGSHTGIDALQSDLDSVVFAAKTLGHRHVVCPYIGEEWRSADGYKKLAQTLSNIGAELKKSGLQMCYHNHAFEFEQYDGEYGLDLLYSAAQSDLLHAEIDTFWVQKGGVDPAAYVQKYQGRAPLIHLKDMDANGNFAPVGTGTIDWQAIFKVADETAVAYIVEQDSCEGDPFDSVATSIANLKAWGKL